jgi:hypothetical protein
MPDITSQYKYVNGALLLIFFMASIAPFMIDIPNVNKYSSPIKVVLPACFVKAHTGKECSTCGLTRSVVALYNGDFKLSIKYHPAGYIVVCLLWCELLLRFIPARYSHRWVPWFDLGQLIVVAACFKIVVRVCGS